ncbi:MAG: TolC family protein [Runella zeae]
MGLNTRCLFLFIFLFCHSLKSIAQVLTIQDAIEASFSHYPTLQAKQMALEANKANITVVRDNRLPNVRLHDQINIGTANGISGSYFSLGLIVPTSGGRRSENRADLASGNIALASMDWEVYNFGRFEAEQQLAQTDIAAGESDLERAKFGLRQAVINTYLDLLWLQKHLNIEQMNIARIDTINRIITNLVRNGIKPGLDSSLVRVQVSKAKMSYWQVYEQYQQALIQLSTLTGHPADKIKIDSTFSLTNFTASPSIGLLSEHPLLRYHEAIARKQSAEISLLHKSALPRLSLLTAAWTRGSSIDVENNYGPLMPGLIYSKANVLVGAAFTVNLTDFRRANHRIQLQEYRVKETKNLLANERLNLQNAQMAADSVLSVLKLELQELPRALQAANAAYNQRLSRYNNGLENILGLTDAVQVLRSVEKDYIVTQSRAIRVYLQRAYATNDFESFFTLFRH